MRYNTKGATYPPYVTPFVLIIMREEVYFSLCVRTILDSRLYKPYFQQLFKQNTEKSYS